MIILSLPSSRKDGKATGIDTVCTYYPDHMGHGLATEQLYLELSNLTHGVTQLGPYTLDQDSLYVNGAEMSISQFPYWFNKALNKYNLKKERLILAQCLKKDSFMAERQECWCLIYVLLFIYPRA